MKLYIPNLSFFIINNLSNYNNLNFKTIGISDGSYDNSTNNANLNSIAYSSEGDSVNTWTMYSIGLVICCLLLKNYF